MGEDFDEIELKVKNIIEKSVIGIKKEVTKDSTIAELGGDSLSALVVLSALEQEFEIDISDEESREIASFSGAVKVVKKLVNG
jgi:acyl carrier protein